MSFVPGCEKKRGNLFTELVMAVVPRDTSTDNLQKLPESNCLAFFFHAC